MAAFNPITDGIVRKLSEEEMAGLIREWPEMLRQGDEIGCTPLHHAASSKAPLVLVQLLVQAWDQGLRERNHFWCLPLSSALVGQAPLEVVQFLAQSYHLSLSERSRDGTLPLHHAVEGRNELAVVKFLAKEEPEALQKKDNRGRVPLHFAAHVGTLAVVQFLAEASASTLREKMDDGRLPLHLAARHRMGLDVVKLLVNKWPDAIFVKDASGRTPFDAARSGNKMANALWLAERTTELCMCAVCHDERADHMFRPCRHLCVCGSCAQLLQASYAGRRGGNRAPRKKAECPICRAIATECERVHLPGSSM
jgi:ankyrin repeat protein